MELIKGHTELIKDNRDIHGVYFGTNSDEGWTVGVGKVTNIEAYDEHGERDWVPWVAVYIDGKMIIRRPASQCEIHYKKN